MSDTLHRLWVEFDVEAALGHAEGQPWAFTLPAGAPGWLLGCGVSGYDRDDCLELLRQQFFTERAMPPIRREVPDVDVATLPELVRIQMGVTVYRGVWFPALNRRPPD